MIHRAWCDILKQVFKIIPLIIAPELSYCNFFIFSRSHSSLQSVDLFLIRLNRVPSLFSKVLLVFTGPNWSRKNWKPCIKSETRISNSSDNGFFNERREGGCFNIGLLFLTLLYWVAKIDYAYARNPGKNWKYRVSQ